LNDEVIRVLEDRKRAARYGDDLIPTGILLFGAPGTGKTFIIKHLAEELDVPFHLLKMSDIHSTYMHESSKKLRAYFEEAIRSAPCILFLDEIESAALKRGEMGKGHSHRQEEIGELLQCMADAAEKGVLVIAATNEPQLMDPAVLRTGRLDEHIYVPPPDEKAREAAIRLHMEKPIKRPSDGKIDYQQLAARTAGFSQSDLASLVRKAARTAFKREVPISQEILMEAVELIPPSLPPEEEARYRDSLPTRGIKGPPRAQKRAIGFIWPGDQVSPDKSKTHHPRQAEASPGRAAKPLPRSTSVQS
jgi:transitional endoplasmic reticulum ATPase